MTISQIIGILSLIATVLTFGATYFDMIQPGVSVYILALAAAINAFTARVTGTPEGKS